MRADTATSLGIGAEYAVCEVVRKTGGMSSGLRISPIKMTSHWMLKAISSVRNIVGVRGENVN